MAISESSDDRSTPAVRGTHTAGGVGVVGASEDYRGVEGRSTKGSGVVGVGEYRGIEGRSANGIGVFGQGGGLAGMFEGNVEITGGLSVHGVPIRVLVQRLKVAEQNIKDLAAALPGRGVGGGGAPGTTDPHLSVMRSDGQFVMNGYNFLPNAPVRIRVVDGFGGETGARTTADAHGKFRSTQSITCRSGWVLYFSATDKRKASDDHTGVRWSNTVQETCP